MTAFSIPAAAHIAVAVSGGADSMALALLAYDWATTRGVRLTALTVDHRLRPEAADEAQSVAAWLGARGIAHHTLAWGGGVNVRHLNRSAQDAARDARYALLSDWARAHNATHILLAHHADDQIETFFIRLSRGSGLQGLGAMDAQTTLRGVTLLRPLLDFSKDQFIATCQERGQPWIEDPSNISSKYTRSRFRRSRALLEAEGLTPERLLTTIKHLQRAREAIQHDVAALRDTACIWNTMGVATLSARRVFAVPDEVSLRLLSDILRQAGGQTYGPRFESLARLHAKLKTSDLRTATLHGCCVTRTGDAVTVMREPSAIVDAHDLRPNTVLVWDGRFEIATPDCPAGWRVRAYHASDKSFWAAAAGSKERDSTAFDGIPATVRKTLPVIVDQNGPVAMPHLGLALNAQAEHIKVRFIG